MERVSGGVRLTFISLSAGLSLNNRQRGLLHDLAPGASIRIREFIDRYASEVTDRQARRDLADLEAAGLLRREGSGLATAYCRTEKRLDLGNPDISGHNPDMMLRPQNRGKNHKLFVFNMF